MLNPTFCYGMNDANAASDMQQDPDKEILPMSERMTLPVLPLREVVLFPGVSLPIGAGRPATLRAIEAALKSDSHLIFAVAQRENVDNVTPGVRSEERRVGKECRSRWSPYH